MIQAAIDSAFEYILEYQDGLQQASLDAIKEAKPEMEINILSDDERQPFMATADQVEAAYIEMTGDSGKKILDQFKADLDAVSQ